MSPETEREDAPPMERMSGLDAGFYYFDSPGMHLHIGAILVFSRAGLAGRDPLEATRARIEARIGRMERFMQRVVEVPFGLAEPYWVDDAGFSLDRHLHLANPGHSVSIQELVEMAGASISVPLDKAHALWEITVVPEVEGDRFALLAKIHHVLLDGVLGIEVLAQLFDLSPDAPAGESTAATPGEPTPQPGLAAFLREIGDSVVSKVKEAPVDFGRLAALAKDWVRFSLEDSGAKGLKPLFGAPRTPINGNLGTERRTAVLRVPLAEVESLATRAGVRMNDVVLWTVSTGLARYLSAKGWQGDEDLVAMMPMAHSSRRPGAGSNQVTALFVSLYNTIPDAIERLSAIAGATAAAKRFHREAQLADFVEMTKYVPPLITWAVSRALHEVKAFEVLPPAFNLLVTTVRGIDFPLYFSGSELLEVIPFGPLAESAGLNVTAVSYNGVLEIGLVGEERLVPGLAELPGLFEAALAELADLVRR